jgi:mono/diheme cytochrome c family protein
MENRIPKVMVVMLTAVVLAGLLIHSQSPALGMVGADAAAVYKAKCSSCHAPDGSASTAAGKSLKLRDLRSADVQKQSDPQLYEVIAKGKGKMPGYEKTLGADSCRALVAYIRQLK